MNHRQKKKRFSNNNCPECRTSDTCGHWDTDKRPYRIVSVFCFLCLKIFWLEKGKIHSKIGEIDNGSRVDL
jgi:hypothetical protein